MALTLWYQIPPYSGNADADLMVVLTMLVLSLVLVLVPFIPGIRDIPRWIPVHRLIWRRYYVDERGVRPEHPAGGVTGPSVPSGS